MRVRDYRRWMCSILCVLLSCVRPLTAVMCTPQGSEAPVHEIAGNYDQSLSLNAEMKGKVLLATWTRRYINAETGKERPEQLVMHFNRSLRWNKPSDTQRYAALYNTDDQQGLVSFRLEVLKMNCAERDVFESTLTGYEGPCFVKYNVTLVADPLPPSLKNETVKADAGETVTVLCEANVGYPAGDIWWYYVPSDGSPARRLLAAAPEISLDSKCRFYAKSKLVTQVKQEDHMAKFRCVTKTSQQRNKDFAEATIYINGLAIPTPSPTPCVDCTNPGESVGDGDGGSSTVSLSRFLLSAVLLLPTILHTFRSAS